MSDRDRTDTREENGSSPQAGQDSSIPSTTDRDQPSALGGDVATRSGTASTNEADSSGESDED